MLSKDDPTYRKILNEDAESFVLFSVFRQIQSQAKGKRGIDHIENIYAYCRTLMRGYMSGYAKKEFKRRREEKKYMEEHFKTSTSDELIKMNQEFDKVEETMYNQMVKPSRLYRIPYEDATVSVNMGEIAARLRTSNKKPTDWTVFFWHYLMEKNVKFTAFICDCSERTIANRVTSIKSNIKELVKEKYNYGKEN